MGLLDRLIERFGRARATNRGAALEAQGRLAEAYELYQSSGRSADAARVMLAQAEAEPDPARRVGLLALAASAHPGCPAAAEARSRKALLSLDLLRARPGSLLDSEQRALARDLESAGLQREAAEVFGLVGDVDNQSRLLAACGAIDALESALRAEQLERVSRRGRQQVWNQANDIIALGQRVEAIKMCESWLTDHPTDEEFRALARDTRQRLLTGPCVEVELGGRRTFVALGEPIIIGRSEGTIVLPSPALSRKHLAMERGPAGPIVRDLRSRNGTMLAGARLAGPIEIGGGITLSLGGQIECRLEPWRDNVIQIVMDDRTWLAPLGDLQVDSFVLAQSPGCLQLAQGAAASPALLNGLVANMPIDLCGGDEIRTSRDGPVLLKVLGA